MSEIFEFGARDTVLVIGLGRSGLACVEVLRGRGVTVYATDEKPARELAGPIAAVENFGARFVAPTSVEALAPGVTSAVLSPGIPPTSPVVRAVNRANVPVIGEIELAYRLCRAPIIAVTGTKGKSTTTALTGHLLRACGFNVRVGGNIGNPLIKEVLDAGVRDWVVAEVSSFQLETIRAFKPRVAVLLNVVPDHLDRYYSMDEYAEAKYRIFANQGLNDWFVGNLDDPRIAQLHWRHGEMRAQARQLWFTLRPHEEWATMFRRDGMLTYVPIAGDPRPVALVARDEIALPGEHNVQNAMAALLAALAVGCEPATLREGISSFRPMPHRLEDGGRRRRRAVRRRLEIDQPALRDRRALQLPAADYPYRGRARKGDRLRRVGCGDTPASKSPNRNRRSGRRDRPGRRRRSRLSRLFDGRRGAARAGAERCRGRRAAFAGVLVVRHVYVG